MSKNLSETHIREMISNSNEVREVIGNGYTVVYQVNNNSVEWPSVGKKRKYPFDINSQNQNRGVKKSRSN
jgi:hypothetical protein